MTVFAIIKQPGPNIERLGGSVAEHFADRHYDLGGGVWLVAGTGAAKDVADKLGVTDGTNGSAVVVEAASYYGRANPRYGRGSRRIGKPRMAKPTDSGDSPPSPDDFPQTTPRDLYATSDIRFVMLKLGELMAKVDSLTSSSSKHGEKLDTLNQNVAFVRGAMWVIGGLIVATGAFVAWYFSGKLSITLKPGPG